MKRILSILLILSSFVVKSQDIPINGWDTLNTNAGGYRYTFRPLYLSTPLYNLNDSTAAVDLSGVYTMAQVDSLVAARAITGTGVANNYAVWAGTNSLGNGALSDNGTFVLFNRTFNPLPTGSTQFMKNTVTASGSSDGNAVFYSFYNAPSFIGSYGFQTIFNGDNAILYNVSGGTTGLIRNNVTSTQIQNSGNVALVYNNNSSVSLSGSGNISLFYYYKTEKPLLTSTGKIGNIGGFYIDSLHTLGVSGSALAINQISSLDSSNFAGPITGIKFITSGGTSSQVVLGNGSLGTYSAGGISTLFNKGSGYRLVSTIDTIKTIFANAPIQIDSSSNTDGITIKVDTSTTTGLATLFALGLKLPLAGGTMTGDITFRKSAPMLKFSGSHSGAQTFYIINDIPGVANAGFTIVDSLTGKNALSIDASDNIGFVGNVTMGGKSSPTLFLDGTQSGATKYGLTSGVPAISNDGAAFYDYSTSKNVMYFRSDHVYIPTVATGSGLDSTLTWNTGQVKKIASGYGTYLPALTNTTNITSSSADTCSYTQNGDIVTVGFDINWTPTAANTQTVLTFTLPIAVKAGGFPFAYWANGTAYCENGSLAYGGVIAATVNGTTVTLTAYPTLTTTVDMKGTFQYRIN